MKRSVILIAALALTLGSTLAMSKGKPKDETTTTTTTTCPNNGIVVSPVTSAQAKIIMDGYCAGQTAADLAMIFMSAGLAEAQIQNQINDASATTTQ